MPRTFNEIKAIVIEFCKVNSNDTALNILVSNAIDIAFYDVAREKQWGEFLILRQALTLTGASAGGMIPCPDHTSIEQIQYNNLSPVRSWELAEKNSLVPPAPLYNKPRSYQVVQGALATPTLYRLSLEPYAGIVTGDTAWISYYMVPVLFSTMASGSTLVGSANWDNEVIKRAEHYVLTYFNKTDQAKELWAGPLARMKKSTNQNEAQAA